jgi:hypothetical protein
MRWPLVFTRPPCGAFFFVVYPSTEKLLSSLISRLRE